MRPILTEFSARWEQGEHPRAEEYLDRLAPDSAVELIYREFCLAATAGWKPDPTAYRARFPAQGEALDRLFRLHDAFTSADLRRWVEPDELPDAGDEIGPYFLERELGRGAFARVFLARQTDLDDRPVVVKVSMKVTPEHRLLARAQHPHIVEILTHGTTGDGVFQMIVMPFLGGATLSAILIERRQRARRPRSGRELLADLDQVAAPEYRTAHEARPARDLIARTSYPRAVAWIIARLAEALDNAFEAGVAHGDLKPSNVLLTADGTPMLLDFNLAVGWRPDEADDVLDDAGGTLAYMAPERLESLAEPAHAITPRAADRHRADVYALGVLLSEVLTGRAPEFSGIDAHGPRRLAAASLEVRRQKADARLPAARGSIPLGLRPILSRCLAPDPADRYKRASELADDLDRWRTDQRLAHATEPAWQYALLRWPRRRRRSVAAVAVVLLAAAVLGIWTAAWFSARQRALSNLARYWDRSDSDVLLFRRSPGNNHSWASEKEDRAGIALRHLTFYKVDDPSDWRRQPDVCDLPTPWRDELEIWLSEQALRYALEVAALPEPPEEWRQRAAVLLKKVQPNALSAPLEALYGRLVRKGAPQRVARPIDHLGIPAPRWIDEYLQGIATEAQDPRSALAHFQNVLAERPESFWGHQRSSAMSFRLGEYPAASEHLRRCIVLRPRNSRLYGQLVGCLTLAGRHEDALESCNRGLALDPLCVELYFSRSLIWERFGHSETSREDLDRFSFLARRQGLVSREQLHILSVVLAARRGPNVRPDRDAMYLRRILEFDPENAGAREALVHLLIWTGDRSTALKEVNIALDSNPNDLWARFERIDLELRNESRESPEGRAHAREEIRFLLHDPHFDEFLNENPVALKLMLLSSWINLKDKKPQQALIDALQGLEYAEKFQTLRDEAHYSLGRAYAASFASGPASLDKAAGHLNQGIALNRSLATRFKFDPIFDPTRKKLNAILDSNSHDIH